MRISPRFAVTSEGEVIPRRRPVVASCHALGNAVEWVDGRLDELPGWHRDDRGRWEFYRYALWGCHLRLSNVWMRLHDVGTPRQRKS